MKNLVTRGLTAVSLFLALAGAVIAAEKAPDSTKPTPAATSAEMMQEASPKGQTAMREFMQCAPQAMANMMEMTRRMGSDGPIVGMTRMTEMFGSMGGQGGMMQPGNAHPGK